MKKLIIVAHVLLGILLIFYGGFALLSSVSRLYQRFSHPTILSQGTTLLQFLTPAFIVLLGSLSVYGSSAFRDEKRWAIVTLPLVPLALSLWIFYELRSASPHEVAWTGGIVALIALVLMFSSVVEMLFVYLKYLRKPAPVSLPPVQ